MSPKRKQSSFLLLVIVFDVLALVMSVGFSYSFRFVTGIIPYGGEAPPFAAYWNALIVIIPVYIIFFRYYGLYQVARHIRRIEEIFLVGKAVTFSIFVLTACTFFYRGFSYSRNYLFVLWISSIIIISSARYLVIQWEYHRRRQQRDIIKVLIVGANRNARSIIQWAQNNPHYGRKIVGLLSNEAVAEGKHFDGIPILGSKDQCEELIETLQPDEVILLDNNVPREKITDLVAMCEDKFIDFKLGADFYGLMTKNVDVEYISTVPLLGFRTLPLDDPWNAFVKRLFDFVVSLVMVVCSAPIWVLAAIAVKVTSKGPLFYGQERMGRDQKLFNVLKFRTMKVDAEKETGPVWAKKDDDRRTLIGTFLRRWNIDELPQLLNVLKGDMSLVGPRPERPHFIEQFRESIPRYMARHKIKSGLTGWAAVNGYRGDTSIQERIKYDLYYMENWSLLFDIEILFMTSSAFKNAY